MKGIGIDLGSAALHVVTVVGDDRPTVADARVFLREELDQLVDHCRGADGIAIDAPSDLCTTVHAADGHRSPKFRVARCAEIAAGEQLGIWVPWVTPADESTCKAWMVTGFEVWEALRDAGHAPMEVFPTGCFQRMVRGGRLAKKQTIPGRRQRVDALSRVVELPPMVDLWDHDGVDAAAAALVAFLGRERAHVARHDESGCDGSEMWFPPETSADRPEGR